MFPIELLFPTAIFFYRSFGLHWKCQGTHLLHLCSKPHYFILLQPSWSLSFFLWRAGEALSAGNSVIHGLSSPLESITNWTGGFYWSVDFQIIISYEIQMPCCPMSIADNQWSILVLHLLFDYSHRNVFFEFGKKNKIDAANISLHVHVLRRIFHQVCKAGLSGKRLFPCPKTLLGGTPLLTLFDQFIVTYLLGRIWLDQD